MLVEEATKKFYKDKLKKHGRNHKALGWGSFQSQLTRFSALSKFIDVDEKEISVLDVGCGFADYAKYLSVAYPYKDIHYVGIDFVEEMVEKATLNLESVIDDNVSYAILKADLKFTLALFCNTPWFDYVVASGIFAFASYIKMYTTVYDMITLCKKKVIFNCLKDTYIGQSISGIAEHDFYANPEKIKIICEEFGDVEIFEDYLPNDFTICIEKRGR